MEKAKRLHSDIKVGDFMTRDFVSTSSDTNLKECAKIMIKKKVGSIIITKEGRLDGILTEKDIIYAIVKKSEKDLGKIYNSSNLPSSLFFFTLFQLKILPFIEI